MCKQCRCTHKLYINVLQFVSASAPFTHAWTSEKNCLILILQCESFPFFVIFHREAEKLIIAATILFTLVTQKNSYSTQKSIELRTDQKQTGGSAVVQSNGMNTIYITSMRITKCTLRLKTVQILKH